MNISMNLAIKYNQVYGYDFLKYKIKYNKQQQQQGSHMALCRAVQCYYHHRFTWPNLHHILVIFSNSTKAMVKIKIYITFTPRHDEKSDFHHAVVKSQIYTTPWWKVRFTPCHGEKSDLHHTVGKSQIYMTYSPCHGENSDLHDIYTTPWWKLRFTWHLHHAVVKIEIYTTFSPRHGEISDLHNIFMMPWWKFRFTRHLHHAVVKI